MPHPHLIALIEKAFAGVVLGNGIGLWEADAIDSFHSSPAAGSAAREKDENHDWRRIPTTDLDRCFSSYNWLDAEGLRFYLPAMMIAELSGVYGHSVGDRLACPRLTERYDCFSQAQREAVVAFLNWCLSDGEYSDSDRHDIMESLLNGYWRNA